MRGFLRAARRLGEVTIQIEDVGSFTSQRRMEPTSYGDAIESQANVSVKVRT